MKKLMTLSLVVLLFVSSMLISSMLIPFAHAQTEVTVTKHVRLGFTATYPFSQSISDDWGEGAVSYSGSVTGEAHILVDMGVDITLTYDTADILPGQPMQLQITYTPTDDLGPEMRFDASGTITLDVDVAWWAYASAWLLFPWLEPALAAIDSIHGDLPNFDLAVGSADFTAPLNADPPVVVTGYSDTAVLSFLDVVDILGVSLDSSFTLSPVPLADFPDIPIGGGAGGAVAFLSVSGATLTNPGPILGVPGLPSILEWGTSGESITATIQLPSSLSGSGTVDLVMEPLIHWLGTSANLDVNLDLMGVLDIFGDKTFNVFSGSLGPIYQQVDLDTTIGNAVASSNPFGLDPGAATLVGSGFIPVPLLDPEISPLSQGTTPTLGSLKFTIDLDSDDDGLMDGTEIALGTNPNDPDSDDDGLLDGEEIALGTNPLDADTDDDGLTDGDEVKIYGTDPLDPDTDDDGLTDGYEVSIGTDPLDPDTDDDGLIDGIEVLTGTDPLDSDTDGDGLLDGYDVEFIQNIVNSLPTNAFKKGKSAQDHRTAINSILDDVESYLLNGENGDAIKLLQNLRKHVDGDPNANLDDWIINNAARKQVRDLIDILLSNLSP